MTPGLSKSNESGLRESNQVIWLNEIRPRRLNSAISGFLRHGTQKLVERRNAHLDSFDFSGTRGYRAYLRCEAEALLPLEAALEESDIGKLLPDWKRRTRSAALNRDLLVLDVFHDPLPIPKLRSAAEVLGICYALEATRMGSRIALAKLTEARPDDASMAATSFLRHGLSQRFWPSFLEILEQHRDAAAHPGHILHAAQMALGMFDSVRGAALHPAGVA
jgi:heme oxygenase (biliverdin-IX-beta and delta-forming)